MNRRISVTVLCLAVGLMGCGAQGETTPPAASGEAPTQGAEPSSGNEAADTGELVIAMTVLGNENLDPIKGPTDNSRYLHLIYDSLVGITYDGTAISKDTGIAEDWSTSEDGLTYNFSIRPGVMFHNGDEVTAEDVKFSLDRVRSEDSITNQASLLRSLIESVEVVGTNEVEVQLTAVTPVFLNMLSALSDTSGLVMPKEYIETVGDEAFGEDPVGSGPYQFVERQIGSQITLERASDDHFAVGRPRFDRVTLRLVPEESTRLAMLRSGDADFVDVGVDQVNSLEEEGFQVFPHLAVDPLTIMFQLQREDEATLDQDLREAMSLAINREELAEFLMQGLARPSGTILAGQLGVEEAEPDRYDPERAAELLAEAGYGPEGEPLTIELQTSPREGWPQMLRLAESVQAYWNEIGIESTITYRDYGALRAEWGAAGTLPAPAALLLNFGGRIDYQPNVVSAVMRCEGVLVSICDPELDALIAEWATAGSVEEYEELANTTEQYLHDNFLILPILIANTYYVGSDDIASGFSPGYEARGINARALVWDD